MTDKSHLDSKHFEPLLTRIDALARPSIKESKIASKIFASNGIDHLTLDPPFFTRLTTDAGLPQNTKRLLLSELSAFGIAWLGDSVDLRDNKPQDANWETRGEEHRISPIGIDQPIDVESFRHCSAIELQLFGLPFQTLANSRRARWTPALPIDLSDFEQMEKKIGAIRVIAGGNCPIGAAVGPGAVYEDLRFLIDSGFDFITLLVDVQYALSLKSTLQLAPMELAVEQAIKAVQDAGARTKILVSASLYDGVGMFRCLQLGATAISIDAFIVKSKPEMVAPAKETFGSVLSPIVPITASATWSWLKPAMTQLILDLQDCVTYTGSVARWSSQ